MFRAVLLSAPAASFSMLLADLIWIWLRFPEAVDGPVAGLALLASLAPVAIFAGVTLAAIESAVAAVVPRGDRLAARLVPAGHISPTTLLVSVPLLVWLASSALSGRRAQVLAFPGAALGLGIGAGVLLSWIVAALRRGPGGAAGRAPVAALMAGAAAMLAVSVGAFAADKLVLVRLYAPLHLLLRLIAAVALQAAFVSLAVALDRHKRASNVPDPGPRFAAIPLLCSFMAAFVLAGQLLPGPAPLVAARVYGSFSADLAEVHHMVVAPTTRHRSAANGLPRSTRPDRRAVSHGRLPHAENLLLITVDALRADHLGAYGYRRRTSPSLDLLAAGATVFERAYTAAPHTSFALTSIMIGRPAVALAHLGSLDGHRTLAELARLEGSRATAAFFSPAIFFVDPEKFRRYEARHFGFEHARPTTFPEQRSPVMRTDEVLEYLRTHAPRRFVAWAHYFAPHEPYLSHPEVGASFGETAVDRYDSEIALVDREVGRLIEEVRSRYPSTAVILTADHGEEFGEHGGTYHGTTLFDEQIRVPLIVSVPGAPPARIAAPVSTLDILPTALSLLGILPPPDLPGTDLAGFVGRGPGDAELPPVVAENGASTKMVAAGREKLICDVRRGTCMLFDIVSDPTERRDLSSQRPLVVARLRAHLLDWMSGHAAASPDAVLARARLKDRTALPSLAATIGDRAAAAADRRAAARATAALVDESSQARLGALYAGEQDDVVAAWLGVALTAAGDRRSAAELPARVKRIGGQEPEILPAAAVALCHAGDAAPVDFVARALANTDDVEVRCEILRCLGRSADLRNAGPVLVGEYDTIRTRICSAEALATLQSPATVPFMASRLVDEPYASVQRQLVRALERIGGGEAESALSRLSESASEPDVRGEATAALERLRGQARTSRGGRARAGTRRGGLRVQRANTTASRGPQVAEAAGRRRPDREQLVHGTADGEAGAGPARAAGQ